MLARALHGQNNAITKEQLIAFFHAAGGLDENKCIKIAGIVNFISENESE